MRWSAVAGDPVRCSAWVAMPVLALVASTPAIGAEQPDALPVQSARASGHETALQARAEQPSTSASEVPYSTTAQGNASRWEFAVTPYLWLSDLSGDVGVFPPIPEVNAGLSFSDVLDNLKFAAQGIVEARRGRFVALGEFFYVELGTTEGVGVRDPEFAEVKLDAKTFTPTVAAGYRVVDKGPLFVDLLGGVRVTYSKNRIEVTGPVRTLAGSSSETVVDPVIGARLRTPLSETISFALLGDIGGFGVSSELTWQLFGTIRYDVSDHWTLSAGWRQYSIDYKDDGFIFDVSMGGPVLAATYRF